MVIPGGDEETLEQFCSKFSVRKLSKNTPLLYQGEIPPFVFYVKSGVIKMYNITANGEEKIVGYESHGGLLPIEWVFNRSPVSSYYYDTFTDCEVYPVPKSVLQELFNSKPKVALALLNRVVSMYIGANIHLHALEQTKARNKLLYIFQYLVLRFGESVDSKNSRIDLRLTHQDIANLIGTTRETATSEIGKLVKEGVITTKALKYIVNTDRALRLLGEVDFANVKL